MEDDAEGVGDLGGEVRDDDEAARVAGECVGGVGIGRDGVEGGFGHGRHGGGGRECVGFLMGRFEGMGGMIWLWCYSAGGRWEGKMRRRW